MQVNFAHGAYRARPVFFGDLAPIDAQMYASLQASLDAFYNSLRQAAAGQRQAMVSSAVASLSASAGHAAEAAYNNAKAAGASEADAKAAAQTVSQAYQAQRDAYVKAAQDVATQEEAAQVSAISDRAAQARSLLNQGFGLEDAPAPSHGILITILAAGAAAYLALKG